jgi:predicted ferric reductase
LVSQRETIALIWVLGIGLAALISSALLISPRTKNWSEKRIVAISLGISITVISLIIYLATRGP